MCVDYVVYIVSKKNGRFVDCDKITKNGGVWRKNAAVFIIGNLSEYTEYSEISVLSIQFYDVEVNNPCFFMQA